jgi:DNA-binding NtrC family response regulator
MRVLVLDQDPGVCGAIQTALLVEGLAADAASDPATMGAAVQEQPYDLVILDHIVTGFSPAHLGQLVFEHQPDAKLLVLTADNSVRRVFGQPAALGYEFVRKPLQLQPVLEAAARLLLARRAEESSPSTSRRA